ncbi:acyl-CoA dehydrogenase family protein [Reyranella sp. CPCC 100927]|uniref:acyl-CoA dehydrogenase family protein n=1 Tax=Reyranella sp. CPCC 100927 TaxID=2599616 RepID=UPI0011B3C594|nr:acyl-CoA dehydrogenase family protein [Reyranella sp. CPCC 100927]TWT06037.1 isovaleryl-CoA dehydrogenase [Reyranella sp. CPCC 100927]
MPSPSAADLVNRPSPSSFDLTADQQAVLDQADRFARAEMAPLQQRMDDEEWWPPQVMPALARMGYLGVTAPSELGGADGDFFTSGLIAQALGRANPAVSLSYIAHENLCLNNILRNADDSIRRRYVPRLCDGTAIGCLALTEPGAGSDALGAMATTARRDGDHYVLNGTKLYITNGPVADVILVYAKTDREAGAKGISAFVVEKGFPGFKVAQKLDKMGFRGSVTAELVFDDCRVPAANRVGAENKGVAVVMSGLDLERAIVAMINLGMAERAFDLALDYARTRRQFGKPIGEFQMVQAKLADMYVLVETIRTFCYRTMAAANELEVGGGGRGDIHKLTAACILYAAEGCTKVVTEAVQIFGGAGYMRETEINRLYRATKLLEIGAGTSEIRRLIIAGELMKG